MVTGFNANEYSIGLVRHFKQINMSDEWVCFAIILFYFIETAPKVTRLPVNFDQ